ncbi:PREDICTED: WD repeat-containing protein 3-like [Tarenaya hassleriana]|uniref:WD repeat-containing protein 3-like n=1 Tax=Tarenaya hassleriana TaxID=28532 RepID=UPI00053C9474|nr:PREDICTED: WD repeat-containing protein 3-like [Tarenaya hassleriana]XP_010524526.1 PREDICTED: WD repeat-containing protein 3-like [Tarenaya hassleriana]XP_010524527.1 PREDICTED: WD repeat-containing protein 3-like [Tarenaya hassleriana]
MVKAYLRYEPASSFGVIASLDSNITYDSTGKHVLSPALEKVGIWHVRQGVCTKSLVPTSSHGGPSLAVTSVVSSPSNLVAVGYADGSIRVWDCEKGTCETTLNGHKGAVTALRYNKLGSMLASGSKDNDVILWDVVGETGLFRLRGHRDQVTDLVFLDSGKKLVSSSKDKFLRVWDLETQHCMQIVSGHHSEIWSIDVDPEERYVVSGSADPELRYFAVKQDSSHGSLVSLTNENGVQTNGDDSTGNKWEMLKLFGEIQRQTKDRVATVRYNKSGNLLACQMAGKTIEIFRVLDEFEAKRKAKRRLRRKEKKSSKSGDENLIENGETTNEIEETDCAPTATVPDVFKLLQVIRASRKICSFSFSPNVPKDSLATLALSLNNNSLEFYSLKSGENEKTVTIEYQGHRSDVRSVTLSEDNTLLMSTSHSEVKIWNPTTGSCLRTVDSAYGLCSLIVPNNKYGIVGTKNGALEIIDIGSATKVEEVEAHGGTIWSIAPIPNDNGFVTVSADHEVKFWEYLVKKRPDQKTKQLTVSNVRSMKMNDDVLAVAISPDAKYIAVALLDSTVKVFYMDSLKFYLSLYGHKLPVMCIDISSDGDLIVTGSQDKNLKIWGLDFGDCHKSIFAHGDSVMAVKFVRNTHYMFSIGKDRLVKYWDADKFELLLTLEGHHAEIWCLAVSNRGDFIVTGSHDRSMRRWDRTEEPFFLEEEKEKRLEEMFESEIDNTVEDKHAPKEEVPEEGVAALAGKKTIETLTATDSIIESLDVAEEEKTRLSAYEEEKTKAEVADFLPNVVMLGLSPSDYVLRATSNVKTNDLEQTLLALPFSDALKLLSYLKDWTSSPDKVELVCRVAAILLQTHHNQLVTTPAARPVLTVLRDILHARVKECKDTIGFNLAAMDHLKQMMSSRSDAPFRDAKAKLMEIRAHQSKRLEARTETKTERRRRKKQKKLEDGHGHGHAWV